MDNLKIQNLSYSYSVYDEKTKEQVEKKALQDVSLEIKKGSFVAILGHNGSGKSTLAKHLNGIYRGSSGNVYVDGMDTKDDELIWDIRKKIGIVFQNPDNQLVSTIVEDDIVFGMENMGLSVPEMKKRLEESLKSVGITELREKDVSNLSGGQKQRVAIAGVLAIEPKYIVLDEPTAMLDPSGRKEVINIIKRLNKEKGITIILITHYMEETVDADRLIVMENGSVSLDDTPINIFKNVEKIKKMKLGVPEPIDILYKMDKLGYKTELDCMKIDKFCEKIRNIGFKNIHNEKIEHKINKNTDEIIGLKDIGHTYGEKTVFEKVALKNINLQINKQDFFGIIGHTGSGKSTLIQTLNALIKPKVGEVYVNRENIHNNKKNLKNIRRKVGVVFQYPEYQLFEETVYKDVCFAPKNMGLPNDEIKKRVIESLNIVGISEDYYDKSPFELSGGEKRRVAIAGVLAMKPDVLVFDELTAGLDPYNRISILDNIEKMEKNGTTIVLVSHSMDDVAKVCNKVAVLSEGEIILNGNIEDIFKNGDILQNIGLDIPKCSKIMRTFNTYGYNFQTDVYTTNECAKILFKSINI